MLKNCSLGPFLVALGCYGTYFRGPGIPFIRILRMTVLGWGL